MRKDVYKFSDYTLVKYLNEDFKLVKVLRKEDGEEWFRDVSSLYGL